ncbi:hypothetical protein BKG83_24425 [Mycobacteroides chelonae]|nr:hypothetical protein BKG83_24425 [Mycobacteroides chelonae]
MSRPLRHVCELWGSDEMLTADGMPSMKLGGNWIPTSVETAEPGALVFAYAFAAAESFSRIGMSLREA